MEDDHKPNLPFVRRGKGQTLRCKTGEGSIICLQAANHRAWTCDIPTAWPCMHC